MPSRQRVTVAQLEVFDTTIIGCVGGTFGGALDAHGTGDVQVVRCCMVGCRASYGFAVEVNVPSLTLENSNLINCKAGVAGLINIDENDRTVGNFVNITSTEGSGGLGAALRAAWGSKEWNLTWCTIENCTGNTVLYSNTGNIHPFVRFCNFYSNTAKGSAVVWVSTWGICFEGCVFWGNSGTLLVQSDTSEPGYSLADCVLDGYLPADSVTYETLIDVHTNSITGF
jgi:hypothetical protein